MSETDVAEASPLDVDEPRVLETAGDRRPFAKAFEQTSLFELEPVSPAIAAMAALPELPDPELRDPRQMAFSVVGRGAAIRLRSSFKGRRLTTAVAVYGALTQLASEARTPGEVRARREDVAAYAGESVPTLDLYAREFERIGLLKVVRLAAAATTSRTYGGCCRSTVTLGAKPTAPLAIWGAKPIAPLTALGAKPTAPR